MRAPSFLGLLCGLVGLGAASPRALAGVAAASAQVVIHTRGAARPLARMVRSTPLFRSDVHLLELVDGSKWVFRPDTDLAPGNRSTRERSVYLTSRHLRLGVFPRTLRGQVEGKSGTLQAYLPDAADLRLAVKHPEQLDWDSVHSAAILHYVSNDPDGHFFQNVLTVKHRRVDGGAGYRLRVIDGEMAFGERPAEKRSVTHLLLADGPPLSARLRRALAAVDVPRWRADLLAEGLTEPEVALAVSRLARVQRLGLDGIE